MFPIFVHFFSCFKWGDQTSPCYSILAVSGSPLCPIILLCFSFILYFLFRCPHCYIVKTTTKWLCARACITHLINIIPNNHDCRLGLFFYLQNIPNIQKTWKSCKYSHYLEVTMLSFCGICFSKSKVSSGTFSQDPLPTIPPLK